MCTPTRLEPTIYRFSSPCDDQRSGVPNLGLTKPDQRKAARPVLCPWFITHTPLDVSGRPWKLCALFGREITLAKAARDDTMHAMRWSEKMSILLALLPMMSNVIHSSLSLEAD